MNDNQIKKLEQLILKKKKFLFNSVIPSGGNTYHRTERELEVEIELLEDLLKIFKSE
jgi:hypothetical protein